MYSFSELCDEVDYPFCYLLGVLKRMPKEAEISPGFFTGGFEWLLNVEEQSDTVRQTQKRSPLTKDFVAPSAPLTMTPGWSPFPLAFSVLPECVRHGRDHDEFHNSAFAIFQPELATVGASQLMNDAGRVLASFPKRISQRDIAFENVHARHFFWLLEMTVERAHAMKRNVIVAGTPGFSFDTAVKRGEAPHMRLRLLEAGYLYPSRAPHAVEFPMPEEDPSPGEYVSPDECPPPVG